MGRGQGGYLKLFISGCSTHMAVGMDVGVGRWCNDGVGRVVGKGGGERL